MTDMAGPTNFSKIVGPYSWITYYLFPREIGVSVDQPARITPIGFSGRTSEFDQEIRGHGFDVRLDTPRGYLYVRALTDIPARFPTNPAWFNS